jgi:hypothetical protein
LKLDSAEPSSISEVCVNNKIILKQLSKEIPISTVNIDFVPIFLLLKVSFLKLQFTCFLVLKFSVTRDANFRQDVIESSIYASKVGIS